ncbi:hypothetical protein TNCV_1111021 [Trichonephila clavipes]|nr:hypothetical protein TNCV_1111021 [Trichonephila clavipes]
MTSTAPLLPMLWGQRWIFYKSSVPSLIPAWEKYRKKVKDTTDGMEEARTKSVPEPDEIDNVTEREREREARQVNLEADNDDDQELLDSYYPELIITHRYA